MLNYFFSANTNNFYPEILKADYISSGSWPDDAVAVSEDIYVKYSAIPPQGKLRGTKDGFPVWVDIPPLTQEQLIDQAEIKRASLLDEANRVMTDWRTELALGMIDDADKEKLSNWMKYIKAVKVMDTSTAPDVIWPELPADQAS